MSRDKLNRQNSEYKGKGVPRYDFKKDELFSLYWDDFLDYNQIAEKFGCHQCTVQEAFIKFKIPNRANDRDFPFVRRSIFRAHGGDYYVWQLTVNKKLHLEHRYIVEKELGFSIKKTDHVHHKDGNSLNNHPKNLCIMSNSDHTKLHHLTSKDKLTSKLLTKHPAFEYFMIFAHVIAQNSHCRRLKVGCVITNYDLDSMYSFGYNGNAKGLANDCDSDEPGACGCIHAEENALLKVRTDDKKKVIFLTHAPCMKCAKLIINSGCSYLYYSDTYRDDNPLKLLHYHGIRTCPYNVKVTPESGITREPYYPKIEKEFNPNIINVAAISEEDDQKLEIEGMETFQEICKRCES